MPPDGIVCAQAFFAVYCASESPLPGVPVPAPCATDVPKAMPPTRTPPARNAPNAATFGLLNMVFPPCLCGEEPSASAPPNLWAESCTRSGACSAGDRHRWFGPPILLPMANHLGTIVAKAKHLDEASLTSRQLQAALLPEVPGFLPGIRLYASYSAASESLDVGGDFYDVVPTPDGPIWLIIGDIEGHDRRAAAQMGQLRSAIRTLILQGLAPEDIIDELRRVWSFLGLTKTATLFPGQLNSSTGQLATASAGHPPPLLVSGASADFLAVAPSPLLGRRSGLSAERFDCCIPDGGLLLLYTDRALRERTHGVDDGMARLRSVALASIIRPASERAVRAST